MARYHSEKESHGGAMDRKRFKEPKRGMEPKPKMEGHMYDSVSDGHYAGDLARRHQEMQDGGMIRENPAAIANLPQEVMIKPYAHAGPYMPEGLDDTIAGVDRQMDYDDSKRYSTMYPKKV
jgi:hypothetical protein